MVYGDDELNRLSKLYDIDVNPIKNKETDNPKIKLMKYLNADAADRKLKLKNEVKRSNQLHNDVL